ncbi:hypothetical protein [Draconibacterium halophilum]|uniref:Uncharacterized protein n=1 Tax=Draconibacterium halophilum TaxID=2706887 RepID=A0A6C0RE47_9BACT|nr:hypothetical protein [Draconibacterium halophilum]QIA08824.1 hypothetical protein G0Q07_14335 [Draconibacterium halophilum]
MASKLKNTEAALLENYRVALENAESQPEIAQELNEIGYSPEVISEGKAIYEETRLAYDTNKTEDDETSVASATFKEKRKELEDFFIVHRKKARVIFRNDEVTQEKLAIDHYPSGAYVKWLEQVKKFYTVAASDTEIQNKLARLAISVDEISQGNTLVSEIETARANYLREVGESQDATKAKDQAFMKLANWMQDFYAVAKIALEDKPQLLEALGLTIRS